MEVALTPLSEAGERIAADTAAALASADAEIVTDRDRAGGRGYYRDVCFKVNALADGAVVEIGDGGFTDWTARLLANGKERAADHRVRHATGWRRRPACRMTPTASLGPEYAACFAVPEPGVALGGPSGAIQREQALACARLGRVSRIAYVSGRLGAGKSSLAAPLAAELGVPLVTKDLVKETLHDALYVPGDGEIDEAWSRRLGRCVV